MKKWTYQELEEVSEYDFIRAVLKRYAGGKLPNSPIYQKIKSSQHWLEVISKPTNPPLAGITPPPKIGKYRKPDIIKRSFHRKPVRHTVLEKAKIRAAYYEESVSGKKRYTSKEIQQKFNVSSGELYRIIHAKQDPLNRRIGQLKEVNDDK